MRILSQNDINPAAWDDCVLAANSGLPYATHTWLRAVANGRWRAAVWENETGGYTTVFPFEVRQKWMLLPYVTQPVFTQRLGLYGQTVDLSSLRRYLQTHFPRTNLSLHGSPATYQGLGRGRLLQNLVLQPDGVTQGYNSGIRSNLAKAAKAGIDIRPTQPTAAFTFFERHTAPQIKGYNQYHSYGWVRLCALSSEHYALHALGAYQNEELVATACFISTASRVIYLMGSASAAGKATGAATAILHHKLQATAPTGKLFDFEGGMMPGTRTFFSGFGAHIEEFTALTSVW